MIWSIRLLPLKIIDKAEAHRCLQLWLWRPNSQQISHRQSLTPIQTRWRDLQSQTKVLPQKNSKPHHQEELLSIPIQWTHSSTSYLFKSSSTARFQFRNRRRTKTLQVLQPALVNLHFPALRLTQTIAHADTKPSATESCPRVSRGDQIQINYNTLWKLRQPPQYSTSHSRAV